MIYTIKKKQFNLFISWCKHYIELFGLFHWEVYYELADATGSLASCGADREGRTAILSLTDTWVDQEPTDKELRGAAKHEVMELLLWDFHSQSISRFTTETALEAARHAIIRRLERVIK